MSDALIKIYFFPRDMSRRDLTSFKPWVSDHKVIDMDDKGYDLKHYHWVSPV